MYPNPIKNTATLEYTLDQPELLTIQLTDLHGRVLKTFLQKQKQLAGTYFQTIDLPNNLPRGMYLVKLGSLEEHIFIKIIR